GRFPELDPVWLADALRPGGGSVAGETPRFGVAPVVPEGEGAAADPGRGGDTLDAPPPVPGYEFLGVLGSGGMGVVYKARHVQLDRIVAVKTVSGRDLADPDVVRRFVREMRAAARL